MSASGKIKGNVTDAPVTAGPAAPDMAAPDMAPDMATDMPGRYWLIGCFLITAIAIFLRVYWIDLKPLHHDEGVNGFFLTTLFREGVYKYDAGNYHGPTLYFFALAFTKLFGLETFAIRYSIGIFGVGMVVLTFCLRRYLGSVGALSAGLFLALSPGMVFVSRYFIHEIIFVFFTFGMVVAIVFFMEKRPAGIWANVLMALLLLICFIPIPVFLPGKIAALLPGVFGDMQNTAGTILKSFFFFIEAIIVFLIMIALSRWQEGRPVYLILASASCVLMFATKETAFISLGTMAIACFCIWAYRNLFVDHTKLEPVWQEPVQLTPGRFWQVFGGSNIDGILLGLSVTVIFLYVGVLFFSSFFTFPEGVQRAFDAYTLWTKTGTKEHADKKIYIYFLWMGALEAPIFSLGAVGSLFALWIAQHRFAMFAALWGFGLMGAYTIIPYKTPWLALSFILPVCLVAGYAINEIAQKRKAAAAVLVLIAAGVLAAQTIELNFFSYDNESRPYVYVQSKREFLDLFAKIDEFGQKTGKGNDIGVAIVSKEYWPMPWYLRNYSKAIFHGEPVPANTVELIVSAQEQENECLEDETPDAKCRQLEHYNDYYELVGTYPMRPGVNLKLYARNDLVGKPLFSPHPAHKPAAEQEYPAGETPTDSDKK
jgi:uncharacterized protein (TIGR03663 family)